MSGGGRDGVLGAWNRWKARATTPAPVDLRPTAKLFELHHLGRGTRYRNECRIRALTNPVFVGDDTVLCRTLGRYKTYVDSRDVGLSAHLMLDGYWEMWVTEAMPGFVRPGMHAVDCGANVGYFTLLLADLVGPDGHVTAVEPNPRMASLLRRSLMVNGYTGRATLCDRPVYDRSGIAVSLDVPDEHPQNAAIAPGAGPGLAMTTISLDDLVGDAAVDFIKIDVEGAEEKVWAGMAGILSRGAPLSIFLEFNALRYARPDAFLAEVMAHGFAVASIDLARGIVPVGPEEILARRDGEDWMLVLAR